MKRESLSERLMKVYEEKSKVDFENQRLKEECTALKQSNARLLAVLNEVVDEKSRIYHEKHKLFMENMDLISYNHLAKLCLERCGEFIVRHKQELGIHDYLIKHLGLDEVIAKEYTDGDEGSDKDDILSLFKQSSNPI